MRFEIAGNGMEIFRERDCIYCMMFEASCTGFCEKEGALQARYLKTSGAAQQKLVRFCSVLLRASRCSLFGLNRCVSLRPSTRP